ncbi:uncharacterized protein [Pseudorasbora parva]|uniref:uncharacterized protein n=1 Tax=Pseudorasbora parva TaxID=51549 RepID=UPI00351EC4D5
MRQHWLEISVCYDEKISRIDMTLLSQMAVKMDQGLGCLELGLLLRVPQLRWKGFAMMEFLKGVLVVVVILAFDLPNACGSLRYSQSPRSMGPKLDPASRSPALSPPGLQNTLQVSPQFQSPLGSSSRGLAQEPFGLQEKQLLQGLVKPLDWKYPIVPEVQSELAVNFQLRQPVTPSSVAVQCGENRVLVEVQQDLFSNGHLIQPTGLSLGGCPVVGQDSQSKVLIFEYELQDCNSVQMGSWYKPFLKGRSPNHLSEEQLFELLQSLPDE